MVWLNSPKAMFDPLTAQVHLIKQRNQRFVPRAHEILLTVLFAVVSLNNLSKMMYIMD